MITTKVVLIKFIIVAFVTYPCGAKSAPHQPTPNLDQQEVEEAPQNQNVEALSEMDISDPPKQIVKKTIVNEQQTYFYPYATSMGPRVGLLFDAERVAKQYSPIWVLGFFYMNHSINANHTEAGVDLQSDSTGAFNLGIRHFYTPSNKFRPFVKGGLSLFINPDSGLANFVDYNKYRIRVAAGLEDLLKDPASLRWDLEGTFGLTGYSVSLIFGYSWAW